MKSDSAPSEMIGHRMKKLRAAKRITVKDAAALIGVPLTTYREWENGRAIQGEPYLKIAEVLGVGLLELMTGEIPEPLELIQQCEKINEAAASLKKNLVSYLRR